MKSRELIALLLTAALALPASGAETSKESDDLFNPTPDEFLRAFCTDRPPKANLPCTVDAGHFQYEADVVNWTRAQTAGARSDLLLTANPTLKIGLNSWSDLEFNMVPLATLITRGPGGTRLTSGPGDLFLRAKINLAGPEGGDFQAALIPYVKAPTAVPGLGDGATEGGVIAPVSFALGQDFTLLFDPEIDSLRNAADAGRHYNYQGLANLSRPLTPTLTANCEIWGQINDDRRAFSRQASLDLSLSWQVWEKKPNLQIDAGANFGLTAATPKIQAFLGLSQRF